VVEQYEITATLKVTAETPEYLDRLLQNIRWRLIDFGPSITITGGAPCDGEGLTAIN